MSKLEVEKLFDIGKRYSRKEIGIKLNVSTSGGKWVTGYVPFGEEYLFIFANIGVKENEYDNKLLKDGLFEWYGNKSSDINQPLMKKIIENKVKSLLFIRYSKHENFLYLGVGKCVDSFDETPARIHFNYGENSEYEFDREDEKELSSEIDKIYEIPDIEETVKSVIVQQRIGHSNLKIALLKDRGYKCEIDGCGMKKEDLLIASHIKPWKDGTSKERLDLSNVLLLCPQHDALFDKGYISFDKNGNIIISKELDEDDQKKLNIHKDMKINVNDKIREYLKYHREHIFRNKK